MTDIPNNSAAYRRGILLGLTMAEIIVLVIFLLLLAFATLLDREKKQNQAFEALTNKNAEFIQRIVNVISLQEPDMAEDIVKAVENLPAIFSLIKESEIAGQDENVDQTIMRALEKLKIEQELKASLSDVPIEQQLLEAIQKQKELEAEAQNLNDQKENLISQMKNEGKGVDWPPCWSTANKKPEYIFTVNLQNEGVVVHDNLIPHRAEEKSRLPIQTIQFGSIRSVSQFYTETKPLFEWSKNKQCRFYVLINDQTGQNEKERFKQLLIAVENHFYKHLNRNSRPSQKMEQLQQEEVEEDGSFFGEIFKSEKKEEKKREYN